MYFPGIGEDAARALGALVIALPMKIGHGSGAPLRIVGVLRR